MKKTPGARDAMDDLAPALAEKISECPRAPTRAKFAAIARLAKEGKRTKEISERLGLLADYVAKHLVWMRRLDPNIPCRVFVAATPERDAEIVALTLQGVAASVIARRLGVKKKVVDYARNRAVEDGRIEKGVVAEVVWEKKRDVGVSAEALVALREEGLSAKAISIRLGVPNSRVMATFTRMGRPLGAEHLAKVPVVIEAKRLGISNRRAAAEHKRISTSSVQRIATEQRKAGVLEPEGVLASIRRDMDIAVRALLAGGLGVDLVRENAPATNPRAVSILRSACAVVEGRHVCVGAWGPTLERLAEAAFASRMAALSRRRK